MRKVDKLIFRAITPPFVITFAVLTFVVSAHEFGTLSELLITKNASPGVMFALAGAILPNILIYSLPLSFLTGVLIGLGGLSGESQILALRACGMPLRSPLRFIFIFGAAIGILTALLSLAAAPRTNDFRRRLLDSISVSATTTRIHARVFNDDLPGLVFYITDLSNDKQRLSGIFLAEGSDAEIPKIVVAREASWVRDPENRRIQLHLEQGTSYSATISEPENDTQSFFSTTDYPIEIRKSILADQNGDLEKPDEARPIKVREIKTSDLLRDRTTLNPEENVKRIIELNRRISLPLSIIPFSILGLALSVNAPKSGRASGFGLGLVTVIAFYALFANGIRMASVGKISPWLGPWTANIILTMIGLFLLSRVEKRFALNHWMSRIPWMLPKKMLIKYLCGMKRKAYGAQEPRHIQKYSEVTSTAQRGDSPAQAFNQRFPESAASGKSEIAPNHARGDTARLVSTNFRRRSSVIPGLPKIMDFYILKCFLVYFLWSLAACTTLFLLLTIFELLDDVIRNSISIISLADYLIFLTPQVLIVGIPMSILLSALVSFGVLERNSEITAVKASGWSLYRLSVPIVATTVFFSVGLFLMQDYVLPYANNRQDNLRNYIMNKPARTSKYPERKWIMGDHGRIYNYRYFDSNQNSFVDLNVYEVDFERNRLRRRIYAANARLGDGIWTLGNGWLRDYESEQFERFKEKAVNLPERAGYFKREIFQPKESSKLTYIELRQYIGYLRQSGYNAIELQVELYKKAAFPVSCLIMALVGIPFAFSVGRKGAFFGIGISIAIAVIYWGISGAFEAMGAYGLLLPILAAWAPNILFAAAGLALFLTIRT